MDPNEALGREKTLGPTIDRSALVGHPTVEIIREDLEEVDAQGHEVATQMKALTPADAPTTAADPAKALLVPIEPVTRGEVTVIALGIRGAVGAPVHLAATRMRRVPGDLLIADAPEKIPTGLETPEEATIQEIPDDRVL